MAADRFENIFQCEVNGRKITRYRSSVTGLTITHVNKPGPVVDGYFLVLTEADDDDGLPHTLEHMIFKGSERYPKGLLQALGNHCLSGNVNAYTALNHTCYTVDTAGSEGFLILLPVYLDCILFPTLSDAAFKTEVHHINGKGEDAGVVYCEMQARENNAFSRNDRAQRSAVFTSDCGYTWETGGMMKNLRTSCSNEKVRAYHKKFYRPENLDIIISGQIELEAVFKAVLPIEERVKEVYYGKYEKPWTKEFKMFDSSITEEVEFPAKDEDNGMLSITWKGPKITDLHSLYGHSFLLSYLAYTPNAPLVKSLIDIPEPLCSRVYSSTMSAPTVLNRLYFEGIKPGKHADIKDITMKTLKETHDNSLDMELIRARIKNDILQMSDNLLDDPTGMCVGEIMSEDIYGGENHELLSSFPTTFETLKDLIAQPEAFWKLILQHYIDGSSVTINCVPSVQCMTDLEAEEKRRILVQQDELGTSGLEKCEKEVQESISLNEIDFTKLRSIINEFPKPEVGENISYHSFSSNTDTKDQGIFVHLMETEFVRFYFTFDTDHLSDEGKALLELYSALFCSTPMLYNGKEISHEEVSKLTEELFVGSGGGISGELYGMIFKFSVEDIHQCKEFIKSLLYNTIFTEDRVSTKLKRMISDINENLRYASSVLCDLESVTLFKGSCDSCSNSFTMLDLLESYKENIHGLAIKLKELQNSLVLENKVILHIITNEKISEQHFSEKELLSLQNLFHLSKANVPSRLQLYYRREFEPQCVLRVVPTDESNYLSMSQSIDVPYGHPDYLAVRIFSDYMDSMDCPLWEKIRGQGFAYSVQLANSPVSGILSFNLGQATNVTKAYLAAKRVICDISHESDFDDTMIEKAKGNLISGFIGTYETPYSSVGTNIWLIHKGLPMNYYKNLLLQIERIGAAELLDVCERYFKKLFTGSSTIIVCCTPTKKDEIVSDLSDAGFNVNIIEDINSYVSKFS